MRKKSKVLDLMKLLNLFLMMCFLLCTITLGGYAKSGEHESGDLGSISGFLWFDENGNGILDSAESKILGYEVSLYQYGNLSIPVDIISTDSEGRYLFEGIEAGDYIIAIQQDESSDYMPSEIGFGNDNFFGREQNSTIVYTSVLSLSRNEIKKEINCAMIHKENRENETKSYQEESEQESLCETGNIENSISTSDIKIAADADTNAMKITDRSAFPAMEEADNINKGMQESPQKESSTGIFHVYEGNGITLIAYADTLDAAVFACEGDNSNTYVIKVNADFSGNYTQLIIPADKNITITSSGTDIYTITQGALSGGAIAGRHFYVYGGTLILKNITLKGTYNGNNGGGGVLVRGGGSLYIEEGATITSCYSDGLGAGVFLDSNRNDKIDNHLLLNGGTICNNVAKAQGGGIYSSGVGSSVTINDGKICKNKAVSGGGISLDGTTFEMNGGFITENVTEESNSNGGGIQLSGGSNYHIKASINGGEIRDNYTKGNGGGILIESGLLTIQGEVNIYNNHAEGSGGGVYLSKLTEFVMERGRITDNSAGKDGGGIFTTDYQYIDPSAGDYKNIGISGEAAVSNNIASKPYLPPKNYMTFIEREKNPFDGTLLDNHNINYVYDGDDAFGIHYDSNYNEINREDTYDQLSENDKLVILPLLDTGFQTEENYKFIKWNTEPDGSGTSYLPNEPYTFNGTQQTLYAIWEKASTFNIYKSDGTTLIGHAETLEAAVASCEGDSSNTYLIKVNNDFIEMGSQVTIPGDKTITITSSGTDIYTITQKALSKEGIEGRHFYVYGGTLILKNITLEGTNENNNGGGGVLVNGGGSLYIEEGAAITKCYSDGSGAGVFLDGNGNDKPGNYLFVNGGTISENVAKNQGGGIYSIGVSSSVTINGGKISKNSAEHGGGISLNGATFEMNGGLITENHANSSGGGIQLSGTSSKKIAASINGGEISYNTAGNGGGIHIFCGLLTINGEVTICKNKAEDSGGGIYNSGEGEIDPNTPSPSKIIMTKGSITYNESKYGGGVFITSLRESEFIMEGGSIIGNYAEEQGGGIYTKAYDYQGFPPAKFSYENIGIGSEAVVSHNKTGSPDPNFPPGSYMDFITRDTNTAPFPPSFNGILLNNYNINYVTKEDDPVSIYGIYYISNYNNINREDNYIQLGQDWVGDLKILSLSDTGFHTEENFKFSAWKHTDKKGIETIYLPGADYQCRGEQMILYATWERVSYSVNEKFVDMDGKVVDSELYKDRKVTVDIANSSYSFLENEESPMLGRITNSIGDKFDYVGYYVSDTEFDSKADLIEGIPEISKVTEDTNVYMVYMPAVEDFTFHKVDGLSGDALAGVVFELYEWASEDDYDPDSGILAGDLGTSWTQKNIQVSEKTGKVTFGNLESGKYMLVEKEALDGYQLPYGQWLLDTTVNPIKITAVSKSPSSHPPSFRISEAQGETQGELLLPNYKAMVMPMTGGIGGIISTVSGIVLGGIGIIFIIFPIKKDKKMRKIICQRK